MKAFLRISVLMMSLLSLTACPKKDSNFAGSATAGTQKSSATAAQAAATGIEIDITSISTDRSAPTFTVNATIMLDGQARTVTTQMINVNQQVQSQTVIGNYNVLVTAICPTANCNPYYMAATAYTGTTPRIQIGYKFYHLEPTDARDNYQRFAPPQNFSDVVNFLNQGGDAAIN